jgi:hypothetical protein
MFGQPCPVLACPWCYAHNSTDETLWIHSFCSYSVSYTHWHQQVQCLPPPDLSCCFHDTLLAVHRDNMTAVGAQVTNGNRGRWFKSPCCPTPTYHAKPQVMHAGSATYIGCAMQQLTLNCHQLGMSRCVRQFGVTDRAPCACCL